jgi:hypothetical protein
LAQSEGKSGKSEDGARRPEDGGGTMSYFSKDEWDAESAVREQNVREQEERDETILDIKGELMKFSDDELIEFVLARGERMNNLDIAFKVYDVCKRLRDHNWGPKGGQRQAIINVACIAAYNIGYRP